MIWVPAIICGIAAIVSVALLYTPPTSSEHLLWAKLNIRRLRRWTDRHRTEHSAEKSTLQNVIVKSRSNIAWHAIITSLFCFLMLRAQCVENAFVQYGAQVFLIPSLFYFGGTLVQRQKMVITVIRRRRALNQSRRDV